MLACRPWLQQRREALLPRAREYGLPVPKGLLILGVPGTGKSLTAKATASVFGVPLLKLDAGKLFGSLLGQSEANLRLAIQTSEAIAPCVLSIDELEKGFGGMGGGGSTDGGTIRRSQPAASCFPGPINSVDQDRSSLRFPLLGRSAKEA